MTTVVSAHVLALWVTRSSSVARAKLRCRAATTMARTAFSEGHAGWHAGDFQTRGTARNRLACNGRLASRLSEAECCAFRFRCRQSPESDSEAVIPANGLYRPGAQGSGAGPDPVAAVEKLAVKKSIAIVG